ncbi:MAG: hypothetical protein HUU02_05675 [Bacteroidetes bacterium]|nr:hypothetical protein [Bacteroidota bacterium]
MNSPTRQRTVISNNGTWVFELLHDRTDPCVWIIRRSRAFLWFRWKRSLYWFFDRNNALEFARTQAAVHRPAGKGTPA